ncbi:hypothetical protein LCGC14_2077370 [marine sediment metagenome]|uniref:Uncharacterized protein n=1 Tax=marine sediment metagenome TaxID=412755 RepID=A0A0F9GV04_9ZZZZ
MGRLVEDGITMSATIEPRREYGTAHLGNVFIHHFENEHEDRYEVRAGNHTVAIKETLADAETVAYALTSTTLPAKKKR